MKRKLYSLIIALVALSVSGFVSAQGTGRQVTNSQGGQKRAPKSVQEDSPKSVQEDSPETEKPPIVYYTLARDKEFAHWSFALGIGASIFDGDIKESAKRVVPTAYLDWGFTGVIERSFNPIWGLGLGYAAVPYAARTEIYALNGFTNQWDIFLSVNMLNLFYRTRPQKWGVFFNIGMGMSHYNARTIDKRTGEVAIDNNGNPMDLKNGVSLVWPLAGLVEYNIDKDWAVGFKAEYRRTDKDNYEGHIVNIRQGNWNDAIELFTLTFRYKPHFGKDYHVRNYHYGDPDLTSLEQRLAELEKQLKNLKKDDSCCIANTERIEKIEEVLEKKPDTVIVVPPPAPVRTIDDEGVKKVFREALRGIQFETAKADIKPISFPILDNVVTIMRENPEYTLEIIGHTDNVGTAPYNLDLSDRRAFSVRSYLAERGIAGSRLSSVGKGLTQPVATNSTVEGRALNRRVEFVVRKDGQVVLKSE